MGFSLKNLDINQYFNSLGMFIKIASGAYSLQRAREITPCERYSAAHKYEYLERMGKLKEYSYMRKYCSRTVDAHVLGMLLSMQRDQFLKRNA
jgi:hypothetical protein